MLLPFPEDMIGARHHYLTTGAIAACQKWSQAVAEKKTHYIQQTWRDWIEATMPDIHSPAIMANMMDENQFARIPNVNRSPRSMEGKDPYLKTVGLVMKVVALSLLDRMPSKMLADTARRIKKQSDKQHEPDKNKPDVRMTREDFLAYLTTTKKGKPSYGHNHFQIPVRTKRK